ncbi:carboxymuconolactone decarboxylase family protein [Edaphobacter aggregans]|uniref:carboxymuconolactone decarboxylase family protein n=1 Tax=Edaphobacter aggregans TaxID=570835 RepID=UPI000558509B|nr:carboxymuconolactone decarboxylase family protein [Edaphobacter aggregans]
MSRIAPVVSSNVDAKVAATLKQVKASVGMVPNLFATLAHSPAALDGYLSLSKVLSHGRLSGRQRELVALAVAQENECRYCLSAHTGLAKAVGVSEAEALKARGGDGDDPFERALASLAKTIVRQRGHVLDKDIERARKAGIDDGLMMEVVANVVVNTFTNYANEVAGTEIDFPVVEVKL